MRIASTASTAVGCERLRTLTAFVAVLPYLSAVVKGAGA